MAESPSAALEKVDPVRAWEPWEPDETHPWNLQKAAHLYRRATFGAPHEELRQAVERDYPATLQRILEGEGPVGDFDDLIRSTGENVAKQNNISTFQLRGWWLYAMLRSPHPLREKMTLFWHNHFVSSDAKVQSTVKMYHQNQLLREHALGKFEPFVQAVSKDAAMLVYLDSNSNIKGKANENYARELMELFTLGVGNYTETDVREAARGFTGWHTDDDKFEFNLKYHDMGTKTVLDQTGEWNGDDIVRIVLRQPVAATYITRKLYRFFVSENAVPPPELLKPLADQFRASGYDIAALVGTILRSRHFFSSYAYRQRIKSPVEYVVGAVKDVSKQDQIEIPDLVTRLEAMGQNLLAPPNVKGWEGGKSWLNSATVLARHNFAQRLTSGEVRPEERLLNEKITDPDRIISVLAEMLLQNDLNENARVKLTQFVSEGHPEGNALGSRVRETIHAMMTMPDYQLA
jgi:uncharacterized protein (DUF1800 family)